MTDAHPPRERLAEFEARRDLISRLVTFVDRSFGGGERDRGIRALRAMLERLDTEGLKGLMAELGVEAPEEMSERERRT